MGKQVNFYMTAKDEEEFVDFVRGSGNVAIFKAVQPSTEIFELDALPSTGEPFWFSMCLWNKELSPLPLLKYIKEQQYYSVNEYESEVIQFHRCGLDEGRLVRGRIFADMSYWRLKDSPPTLVAKSEAFRKWYDRLASWLKRRSTRNPVGDYMLPDAAAFVAQGGQYCQAVLASGEAL